MSVKALEAVPAWCHCLFQVTVGGTALLERRFPLGKARVLSLTDICQVLTFIVIPLSATGPVSSMGKA